MPADDVKRFSSVGSQARAFVPEDRLSSTRPRWKHEEPTEVSPGTEINLAALWRVIECHRWLVLAWIFGCAVVGAAYLGLKTPVFEAAVGLRIGQVAGTGPFEDPNVLASMLLASHGKDVAEGVQRPLPFLRRAYAPKTLPRVLELTVAGDTPERAAILLREISVEVIDRHRSIHQEGVRAMSDRIDQIKMQKRLLEKQLSETSALFETIRGRDPVQAALILQDRTRLMAAMNELETELPGLIQKLSAPGTMPTVQMGEIVAPREQAAPKAIPILTLALLVGVSAGFLAAFVAEHFHSRRASPRYMRGDS